jgi:hypothetical protein
MSVTYSTIKAEIAYYIGTAEDAWDSNTSSAVEYCIRTGVDRVIHNGQHQWSWMRPKWSWKTADGQRRYTLPLDFEQFIPNVIHFDGEHYGYGSIGQLPASRLMQLRGDSDSKGTPSCFAIESVAHDGVSEQQQQLVLEPTPDAEYKLVAVYQIGVRELSDARPYPPGGPAHGELFVAACLAAVETKFRDGETIKEQAFRDSLMAHIAIDLRKQPRNLGSMGGKNVQMRGRSSIRRVLDLVDGYTTWNGGTEV